MATLDVQPKKKGSILPWLLLALGIIALLFFLLRNRDNNDEIATATNTDTLSSSSTAPAVMDSLSGWEDIDFNAPATNYDEVTDKNINVRGNYK